MATPFAITDPRARFCREAMKRCGGAWNPVTTWWTFRTADDAANALCAVYATTRVSRTQQEALLEMAADGTGASAWDFDPATDAGWLDDLSRERASALLAAGYAARKVLGRHPLENVGDAVVDDTFGSARFEGRAERSRRAQRRR
jgi:hypothetical protein